MGDASFLQIAIWGGQTVLILAIILAAVIRLAPTWREIKLKQIEKEARELDVREGESKVQGQTATALSHLAEVLHEVAIEQRRATETIEILQRVNADQTDQLNGNLRAMNERMDRLEKRYVESETTGSRAD